MVELIINDNKYDATIDLLEHFRKYPGPVIITTQERKPRLNVHPYYIKHRYYVNDDWTVKLEDDKLFIISDNIASVIDLKFEAPIMIETTGG